MNYTSADPFGTLAEESKHLVNVARGDAPADVMIRNGTLVNVHTAELEKEVDVAVARGRIVGIFEQDDDSSSLLGPDTSQIDAEGLFLAPGFLDGHVHVESSMCTVTGFSDGVIPCGTTGIFMDPHEIANVLGLDGIRWMMEEAEHVPLKVWTTTSSCVPAAPGFEDTGATLTADDIEQTMDWPWVVGLGEMMNFPGVIQGDEDVHEKLSVTYDHGQVVTGHYASPETGNELNAYISSGVSSCHESVSKDQALKKLRRGMWTQIRYGSAWQDLTETIKAVTEEAVDTRHIMLVTDDCHPETIVDHGHLDRVGRAAINNGLDPITTIQALTLNPAEYFGVSADVGSLAPGKIADIVFLEDLADLSVEHVMVNGQLLVEDQSYRSGESIIEDQPDTASEHTEQVHKQYPERARNTVKIDDSFTEELFTISADGNEDEAQVQVIRITEARVGTERVERSLPVSDGEIHVDPAQDVSKVFCFDRHREQGEHSHGFVSGFGFERGAVASTVSHDSHNLLVVGVDEGAMATAASEIISMQGGMVAVDGDDVLGKVSLPVAGLMSDEPIEQVAERVESLYDAWRELGCDLDSPFMTMGLLALPVLPEIRISNRGLIDTVSFSFLDPVSSE